MITTEKTLVTSNTDEGAVVAPPPYDDAVAQPGEIDKPAAQHTASSDFMAGDYVKDSVPAPPTPVDPANANTIAPTWRPFAPACWVWFAPVPLLLVYLVHLGYSYAQAQRLATKWRRGELEVGDVPEEWRGGERERKSGCCGERKERQRGCCGERRKTSCGERKAKTCC